MQTIFPECCADGSCALGSLLWVAKLFLLETHRAVQIFVPVLCGSKGLTRASLFALPALAPPPNCLIDPPSWTVRPCLSSPQLIFFFPSVWTRFDPESSLPRAPSKKNFKILCVFHGKFHTPVSDSFSIKGSKYWFCKRPLMILIFVGSFFLSS